MCVLGVLSVQCARYAASCMFYVCEVRIVVFALCMMRYTVLYCMAMMCAVFCGICVVSV